MPELILHFINARHQLIDHIDWMSETLHQTFSASAQLIPLQDVDVVVSASEYVMPETGHSGNSPEKGVIYVGVDPAHPVMRAQDTLPIRRLFAHELHHCARWDGPGYGSTLGEALVSEGLAGHFEQEVAGGDPEPWESLAGDIIGPCLNQAETLWHSTEYDHGAWFFGTSVLPKWTGYSLGFQLVSRYLSIHRSTSPSRLVHTPAEEFRSCLQKIKANRGP